MQGPSCGLRLHGSQALNGGKLQIWEVSGRWREPRRASSPPETHLRRLGPYSSSGITRKAAHLPGMFKVVGIYGSSTTHGYSGSSGNSKKALFDKSAFPT